LINNSKFKRYKPVLKPEFYFLFGLALFFRLPGFDVVLAGDELAMLSLWGQMPYEKIIQNYQYPNNHIFLTLILSFLLKSFGLYEWLLRTPLLICGIVSIYFGYMAGKFVGENALVGWMTAFFLVLSEWHIFYSTNARGYLVIMMLGQICFAKLLDRLKEDQKTVRYDGKKINILFNSLGWLLIWAVGSWTLPTFIFFELSVATFLIGIIFSRKLVLMGSENAFFIPLITLLAGVVVFYFQYYVWISPEMLASAKSNAAQTSLSSLFNEVTGQWLSPFEQLKIIFIILAVIGGWNLWKKKPETLFLIVSILLGPIIAGIFGFKLSLLPGLPHARTYFYLQPFFIVLAALGILIIGTELSLSIKGKFKKVFSKIIFLWAPRMIVFILILVAIQTNYQELYLKRSEREPLKMVSNFTRLLNKNDLLIVPDDLHVEFYLYGASEMRQRVENILRDGKVDNIYFLEYHKNKISSFVIQKDKKSIKFLGYPPLVHNAKDDYPSLPIEAMIKVDQFGPFVLHKINPNWLKKKKILKEDFKTVGVMGEKYFQWKKMKSEEDTQYQLKFVDSFLIAFKTKQSKALNSLSLNLMNVSGSDRDFSAAFLEGKMEDRQIKYNPSWKINGWTLDHPYGNSILNRNWNPAISLSSGVSAVAVLDVHFFGNKNSGMLKEFLSYEISMPDDLIKPGVSGT
jgi:hypothetical protein